MEIKVFNNHQFGAVRVLKDEAGEPWLVAKDVATILGYKRPADAIRQLVDKEDKGVGKIPTPGGMQEMTIINESGFYALVFNSKLPQAKKFKRWVTNEVLPAIRKYGGYLTPERIKEALTDPDVIIDLAMRLKEAEQKKAEMQEKVTLLAHTKKTYTSTEIAKELGFKSAIELNKKLEEMGIQYKVNKTWVLTAKYADKGYEEIKQDIKNGQSIYHRKWTQKGREFILSLFKPTAIIANAKNEKQKKQMLNNLSLIKNETPLQANAKPLIKPLNKQRRSTLPSTAKAPLQAN